MEDPRAGVPKPRRTTTNTTSAGFLLAGCLAVVIFVAVGVSAATDIDNDLIFDDGLDADWSPSKESTWGRDVVSPVSSPLLQATRGHKKVTMTSSKKKDKDKKRPLMASSMAKKVKEDKNGKKNKNKKDERSDREKKMILKAFDDDVMMADAAPTGTFDDEDYIDDDISGSGSENGSGKVIEEPPMRTPVAPTPIPSPDRPVFFRSTILMPDLPCLGTYNDRASSDYARLSSELMESIEPLYEDTLGDQVVTLVKVVNSSGCLVTVDLGSMHNDDERKLEMILFNQVVRGGSIGSQRTSSEQFTFRKVEGAIAPKPCRDDEFHCFSDECVAEDKLCDGHQDCRDGSDEDDCVLHAPLFIGQVWDVRVTVGSEAVLTCEISDLGAHTMSWVRLDTGSQYARNSKVVTDDPRVTVSVDLDHTVWKLHIRDAHEADAATYECQIDTVPISRQSGRIVIVAPTAPPGKCRSDDQVHCKESHTCIDSVRICDGTKDCPMGDDEDDCAEHGTTTTPRPPRPPCAPHEWQCSDGSCIGVERRCDRRLDCPDRSDEEDCTPPCASNEFRCDDGGCIRSEFRCDRRHDCSDGSDERNCSCAAHQFQCEYDRSCIDNRRLCDGNADCSDHSDERNCPGPACGGNQFQCSDGNCIEHQRKCDGFSDCPDSSDETSCPSHPECQPHEFRCSDRTCIHSSQRCDGRIHCPDRSDESGCPCRSDQFRCNDGSCIEGAGRCDRRYDCPDFSDEDPSNCAVTARCSDSEIDCGDGNCIPESKRCDGRLDCLDGRDENSCDRACPSGQFACGDATCIDERLRCDGRRDCPSTGYDETQCAQCVGGAFHCAAENLCIGSSSRCNGYPDCYDGSDERDCTVTCGSDQFQCADTKCIDKSRRCDRAYDCSDGSDELNCTAHVVTCGPYDFACHDGECIDSRRKCDGRSDCRDGSDEWNCDCRSDEFRCGDGKCIPITQRCDGSYDCNDFSDESSGCGPQECAQDQFRCNSGQCVSSYSHCDGNYDCSDRSDEENCERPTECRRNEFTCRSGECIPVGSYCDRKVDCRDGSDERDCGAHCPHDQYRCSSGQCVSGDSRCNQRYDCADRSDEANCTAARGSIYLQTYPDSQVIKQGREVVFQCRDEGTQRAAVKWTRSGGLPLPPESSDIIGRLTMPNIQLHHSGVYVCSAVGVLPFSREQKTVNLTVIPYEHPTVRPPGVCDRDQSTCQNGQCVARIYVCDGDFDCSDGSDELSCTRTTSECEPREFECNNKKCILKIWRCDGENDCEDNSDESFCAPANQTGQCQYKEVKCGNTDQCIPKSFQCDGEMDCLDGTDEIGCGPPTIVQPPPEKVMVTVGETVVIVCVAVGTPTPLISWRLNWGHIGPPPRVTTTSENGRGVLTITNVQESDAGAYSCEAINSKDNVLATPDAMLIVQPAIGVCRAPHFNVVAKTQAECIRCFCFSHTDQCFSSNLYITRLPHGSEISISAATPSSSGSFIFDDMRHSLNQDLILHLPDQREYKIDERMRRQSAPNVIFYWSLPSPFLGNKLNSYGGHLQYSILYRSAGSARPVFAPDVVIKGNGITLYHRGPTIREGSRQEISVQFSEGNWFRLGPGSRADGSDPQATREEIMHLLQMLDSIWIRATYITDYSESSLISLQMDAASSVDTGHGRAVYVEQCTCPPGYQGLSCESCASGYSRVRSGSYLGECRRSSCECHGHSESCDAAGNCYSCQHNTEGTRCERCRAGFYGDSRRGTPYDCQPCACPLNIPSNQFSPTCFLDTDNQPTCNACPPGYGGRLCDRCISGYHGNPSVPGQGCTITQSPCDPIGAISPIPDPRTRLCQCKDFVAGPTCSQCQPDTFNLNEHSLGGCINCFCMGVTSFCGSSPLFRAEETVDLYYDRAGFSITSLDLSQTDENNIRANPQSRELTFNDFRSLTPGKLYYWRAPAKFLGNKLTSYGGNLTYTIRYDTTLKGTRSPGADVQISGNHIELNYYIHPRELQAQTTEIVRVPFFERYWKRSDGQPATREHLMMALANLKLVLIKAMYTDQMAETSIKDVKLETTVNYNNGQRRAVEVEQCRCPIGYKGTSCEECDAGYARSGGGLYLGLCEPCFCNGHSSDCDTDTGICKNCQHNTTGDFCEMCLPGFHGDASQGTPYSCYAISPSTYCPCDAKGTDQDQCSTTKRCICKQHANGTSCNECQRGYYNLEASNKEGCTKCFCFGHSDRCTSSPYFRKEILPTTAPFEPHGFTVTDRYQTSHSDAGLTFHHSNNEVHYTYSSAQNQLLFFSLPSQFTGNRLTSYGGKLKFTLKFTSPREAIPVRDADIIIIGNGLNFQYTHPIELHPDSLDHFEVPLTEAHWQMSDPRFIGATTRDNFMQALANIQAILIRATHHTVMSVVVLSNVSMDTAVPQYTGQELANAVEICECPPGYSGLSCEECAPGYIRGPSPGGNLLGECIPCNCHGHSDHCDPNSRQCQRCHHNTVGPNCERCAEGYYGDATSGAPDDCRPCPCPLSTPPNQFSRACYLDTDGLPTCQGCPAAYTGRNCEQCAPGFTGDPRQHGDTCRQPDRPHAGIVVQIQEPKHQQVSEGDTVTFVCVGYTQVRNVTYNVVWTREDLRPLPSQAHEAAGTLTIRGLRTEDSGTYVCTGSDLYGVASDKAFLRVEAGYSSSSPTVHIEPTTLEVLIGLPVEFRCISTGHPTPVIRWMRGHNSPLTPFSTVQDGVLRITSSTRSDEGDYYCVATNSFGSDRGRAVLFIKDDGPSGHPRVTIYPQSYDSRIGETVRFDCRVEGAIPASITWSRVGLPLPAAGVQMDNMLVLPSVDETCRGIYVCTAMTVTGEQTTQATLNIIQDTNRPVATIEHEQQTVPQGSTAEIRCIVTGHPTPTIEWMKVSENLSASHQIVGNTLRIINVQVADRGVYVCKATNPDGVAQASAILEVERREPPAIELYPGNIQTITRGGSALFQCRVTAGAPSPTVEWTREDRSPITKNTELINGGVIRFMHVDGKEQGRYVCTAQNEAGLVTAVVSLVIQGLPEITLSQPSPYTVSVGQRVQIECHTKGDPLPSAYWSSMQPRQLQGYKDTTKPGSAILEISRASYDDAGYYVCTAQNSAGTSEERIQLIVNQGYVPPQQPSAQEFVVQEGARAELRCSTRGLDSNEYLIQWVRADRRPLPVEHTVNAGVLTISNVQRQDMGEYNCLGMKNGSVQFSVSTTVVVVAPPRLELSPVTVSARPGEAVTFRCSATGDDPIHIEWNKMEGRMSPSAVVRGGDLIFQGVSVTDAGRYVCTARNHVGQVEGVVEVYINEHGCGQDTGCLPVPPQGCIGDCGPNVVDGHVVQQQGCGGESGQVGCIDDLPHTVVQQKNHTIYVGTSVDLVCDTYGHPTPDVIWTRDRDSLPVHSQINGNVLRINRARVEDGGRYICTASNRMGSSTDYTILNVQGITALSVSIVPSAHTVRAGETVDVRCVVNGDSSAVPKWSKNDEPLPSNAQVVGDTLRITNVRIDNSGMYRCTVNTYTGSYKEDYHLSIYTIPSLPQNAQVETQTAPLGSTVEMNCRGDVLQPLSYSWSKQGGIMPSNVTTKGPQLTIPDVKVNDAGTYVCAVRGALGTLDVPTILTVTGVVPYFAQAPASYMTLPTLPDAYLTFDIEISFKPESPDGLILYNGQYSDGSGDFISFGLSRGYAEFRFDVGAGPVVLRSAQPLHMGRWHTVKLNRSRKDGIMTVNGDLPITGSASGIFQGLDLIEPLFVGGVKNFDTISKLSGFNQGFVGCISRLIIGSTQHELTRDAQVKVGVTTCETCAVNPCVNNGVCQEAFSRSGYKCICQTGFSGLNCDKIGESCYQGLCGSGRCVDQPDGFQCYCPYGKGGRRCEKDITIYEAAFRDDAYIAYPTPKATKKHKFLLKFKPRHLHDGLLMYSARAESGLGDFISLALKDKKIEFRFDTGSGPVVLRSANELKEDEWVTVVATRDFQEGTLLIDEEVPVRGTTPGSTKGLNLRTPLYVGGVDKNKVNLSPFVDVAEGFDGCISEVEVGDVKLDMANALIDSANVDDCGGHAPCERLPCLNNGKCKETGPSPNDYACTCEEGFGGRNCEEEEDICNVITPCSNGGSCVGTGTSYRCLCPVGFAGINCEKKVKFAESAAFQGDGYLVLNRELLPHTSSTENEKITLSFTTRQKNGIILWHGQTPDVDGKGQDYLALVVEDGYLVFTYELGSGPANIRSSIKVDDGRNHNVVLSRMGRDSHLDLDDTYKQYGAAQGLLQMLNTKGNIYIGGLPNADLMTAGQHTEGFAGCISNLHIQDSGEMHLQKQAIGGVNVASCGDEDYSSVSDYDNTIPK